MNHLGFHPPATRIPSPPPPSSSSHFLLPSTRHPTLHKQINSSITPIRHCSSFHLLFQPLALSPPLLLLSIRPFAVHCCFSSGQISERDVASRSSSSLEENPQFADGESGHRWNAEVGNPNLLLPLVLSHPLSKFSSRDQAFFLLAFIACTTSVAFTSFIITAVSTLRAAGRAATSLSRLADTAAEELPRTMATIRLSNMEISDLTLELSDLSQEISDGITKSAQAIQAAEAGIRQIGSLAHQRTISMIQERADLPVISLQPVVSGAAKKTCQAVVNATKAFINLISRRGCSTDDENDSSVDRSET